MNQQLKVLATFNRFESKFVLVQGFESYALLITKNVDDKKSRTLYVTYNLAMFLKSKYQLTKH